MLVVLDSGPLGFLTNPSPAASASKARTWAQGLLRAGHQIVVPQISDYEVRRELLRGELAAAITRLDELGSGLGYVPVTPAMWQQAAMFWADARRRHRPTAPDRALDGDVLLAAQALVLASEYDDVMVATTNTKHLQRYVPTTRWDHLTP